MGLVKEADTPSSCSPTVLVQGQEKQKETGDVESRGQELESGPHLSLLLEPCCGKSRWPSAALPQAALWLREGAGLMETMPRKKSPPQSGPLQLGK